MRTFPCSAVPSVPGVARLAAAVVAALVATLSAPAVRAEGLTLERLQPALIARHIVGEYPSVVVLVGVDTRKQPISLGEGVVLERREKRCVIMTATGAIGKATTLWARYADDGIGEVHRVVKWEPAPGLALLEADGPCPAVARRLPGDVDPEALAGPVTVFGAPTWGLQVAPFRATYDPSGSTGHERRHDGEAGTVRVDEQVTASFILAGAPVLDPGGRLIGILGRPRKDGRTYGFLAVPSREALIESATRSDRISYYTRLQSRYHPIRPRLDAALYGMGFYWVDHLDDAIKAMTWGGVPAGDDPRYLAALGDAVLRVPEKERKGLHASDLLRRAVRRVPGDHRLYGLLGFSLLVGDGSAAEAEAVYRRALRLAPADEVYLLDLGAALLLGGRYSEAAETFRRALEKARDADKPAIMLDLAIAYFRQGMLDQAFELLRAGRELEPDDRDLQVVSGMVLLQAEKWHEARKLLEKITPRDDPLVLLNLGIALVLCGEPEAGKEKLEQVFSKLDEKHLHDLRVVKGLLDAQDYKKAIRLLHELMLPGTKDAATWRRVALGAEQTKDWKRAAQAWAEVLAREPNSLEARAHRGVALVFTGRHAEAEELLAPCFEEAPNSARVVAFLALARIGQGKLDEAAPLVARLEKLDPALARSVSAAMERRRRADSGRRGKGRRERRRRH